MTIIDCHLHLTKRPLYGRGAKAQLLKEMEQSGVSLALVMGEAVGTEIWHQTDELLEALKGEPKLRAIYGVDCEGDIPAQAVRAEESIKSGEAVAFKLYPGYQYFYPFETKLKPILEVARKTGVPVVIHTGDLFNEGAAKPPLLKYSHPLHVDELAALNPDVTFVIAHLGNPWIVDATEVIYKNKNVYADLSGLFVETIEGAHAELVAKRLREAIAYLGGADRFMFGTDWPLIDHAAMIAFFRRVIPIADHEKFFAGNAKRVFRL